MFAFKPVAFATALLGLVHAAPAVTERQDIILLTLCTDANLGGSCLDYQGTPGVCGNVVGEFDNSISSLVAGTESRPCIFYNNPNCDRSGGSVTLGGRQDALPAGFDNSISSIECLACLIPEGCP
ncbi:hypothetical protein JX265_013464 [Neoarthrinium moseri]|uniref:Uncharacterized protein n=1 Tax=Neoarthrinium moseri TaxID=1658444 RepID=A0A9P9W8J1_9PEZI|nr:uncharacterized protein JN550_013023 [Neoarthrinium moseri]KAI1841364.1 hypothetical protein JX266_012445 [Neoarthrinium moseri]KAI1850185.1 hypothetical protein JX265_013464 [Neoarthrinium moseri]KAI1857825.1 hypothetical protein JN550_013023 [Neoarthrinium moseri]